MRTKPYLWPHGKTSATCMTVDLDAYAPWLWAQRKAEETPYLSHIEQRRYGLRAGLDHILDLFDRYGIRSTFFVPGVIAEDNPAILPALRDAGHEIALHGFYHELVADISDAEFSAALERSIALFEAQTGLRPEGFRSPAWEMTPHMLAEIKRRGFYDSSLMGHDRPYTIEGVTELPVQWTIDDAIYFKFLGGGGDPWPPMPPGPVVEGWIDEWRVLHRFGGLFMVTIHDWISGRAQRIAMLERLMDAISAEDGVWIATAAEIARHHSAIVGDDDGEMATPPRALRERDKGPN